jgi:flavin reductase (DIM6/NTAB) family NADH-FMN oxidoreductase RutF
MFSTIDGWGNRHLQAFAIRPDVRRELEIPSALQEMTRRVRAFPSDANLRALAETLKVSPRAKKEFEALGWTVQNATTS